MSANSNSSRRGRERRAPASQSDQPISSKTVHDLIPQDQQQAWAYSQDPYTLSQHSMPQNNMPDPDAAYSYGERLINPMSNLNLNASQTADNTLGLGHGYNAGEDSYMPYNPSSAGIAQQPHQPASFGQQGDSEYFRPSFQYNYPPIIGTQSALPQEMHNVEGIDRPYPYEPQSDNNDVDDTVEDSDMHRSGYTPAVSTSLSSSRDYHSESVRSQVVEYSVDCGLCGQTFTGIHAPGNLKRHYKTFKCPAAQGKKYPCKHCPDKQYARSDGLLNHMRKKHGAPPPVKKYSNTGPTNG